MKAVSVVRYGAICLLTAIVLAVCVQFVDRPVADFMATHVPSVPPIHYALNAELLIVPFGVLWILGCGIVVALGYDLPRLARTAMLASFSLTWALSANYFLLQPFFGRIDISRYLKDRGAYGFVLMHGHSGIGFPSGHTIIAASFLVVFWLAYPRARIIWGLAIAAVMLGLVVAQWHFLSDTLCGLFVGAIAAMLTMRLLGHEAADHMGDFYLIWDREMSGFSRRVCRSVIAGAALCAVATVSARAAEPPIRHVFVVVLENESYGTTFGPNSPAPYLAHTLPQQGALLTNYYGIGHASLDNYIAMISGQPPNEDTQRDCGTFSEFVLRQPGLDAQGRAIGKGCVYPAFVKTLPDQLEAHGFTWRAYMEDMGSNPSREASACAHVAIGTHDATNHATVGDQYADKHNPFVYFHSIIDSQARCDAHVVNLNLLSADLADASRTPNFVYITPNLCNDGHDAPCVDGKPGGLVSANAFLERWIPVIRNSPAFQKDGLLIITFDEAGSEGAHDSDACCGELPMPGAAFPPGGNGPGGGRIGAVLLSPRIKPGTVSDKPYNHHAMVRSIDDIFGMPHLGLAGVAGVNSFGPEIFR